MLSPVDIILAAVVTGIAALFITIVGQVIGRWAGMLAGRWAEAAGGIILILIGLRILIEHLFS
jgi:putative Mn2+ efflux pump MntP